MSKNAYDIEKAFAEIESEIIKAMIRRLKKDRAKDSNASWKDWRIRQLKGIKDFISSIRKTFSKRYKKLNEWIKDLIGETFDQTITDSIEEAIEDIETDDWFTINKTRMEALQQATIDDLERAEHAVFRKTDDEYRKIIYKAHVALNSGLAPSYDKAVDMATRDFLRAGINCIEYKNGSRHTIEEYAQMALRTAMKRASLMAEGAVRTRLGIHTCYAGWREMACPKCIKFLGRLMVDDVYSVGTREEAEALDAILLSDAMAQGFLHPNCKDTVMTYDPELYKNSPQFDPLKKTARKREIWEAEQLYELEVKENSAKHNVKVYTRMADNQLDEDNAKRYYAKTDEWETRRQRVQQQALSMRKEDEDESPSIYDITEPRELKKEEKDALIEFAKERRIQILNINEFDGDPELLKRQIETIMEYKKDFPRVFSGKRISIKFEKLMNDDDYAVTSGKTITFNKGYLRDRKLTEADMAEAENLACMKAEDIARHEMGHVIEHVHGTKGLQLAQTAYYNVFGEKADDATILKFLRSNVSVYSSKLAEDPYTGKRLGYLEVTSELLALHDDSEFRREFLKLWKEEALK